MPSSRPRLSIGLPVYNGARYLRETFDSILSQSFVDFELIISDNASTDGTSEIAREVARSDRRVTYSRNLSNIGAAGNFTLVFRRASAPLFKWACADDRLGPGFLDAAVRELDAHPEAVLCYGAITLIDADGNELGKYEQGLDLRSPDVGKRFERARQRMGLLNVLQGVMRSEALRRAAPYGAYPGSDEVLVAELSLQGEIHEIPDSMLFRRMHPQAASAATSVEQQLIHLDPSRLQAFSPWFWRHSIEHLRAIGRAPLDVRTKLRLAASVARTMIQIRDHLSHEFVDGARHVVSWFAGPPRKSGGRGQGPRANRPKWGRRGRGRGDQTVSR